MESNVFSMIQLQNWMQYMLVHHAPLTSNRITENIMIEEVVNSSKKLNAAGHLNIYRQSYIARLRACMHSQFGALAFALGKEIFESFADQYLDTYPSESYTLNTLGKKFPIFLRETRPDGEDEQKETWPNFMIELASFEYELSVIFDSPAEENCIIATYETTDDLLILAPNFHLFKHQFPICDYYLHYTQKKEPELPFAKDTYCAVIRQNYKLGLFNIMDVQYLILEILKQGISVEDAKIRLINNFQYERSEIDRVWPIWKKYFIEAGFFIVL